MRVLIVVEEEVLALGLCDFVQARGHEPDWTKSTETAVLTLRTGHTDALFLELAAAGSMRLLQTICDELTMPHVTVVSELETADVGFRLAQLGVRCLVEKPVIWAELDRVWPDAMNQPPNLRPLLRASVGLVGLRQMELIAREAMIGEALARVNGSRRGAAGVLQISRQLLQYIIRAGQPRIVASDFPCSE